MCKVVLRNNPQNYPQLYNTLPIVYDMMGMGAFIQERACSSHKIRLYVHNVKQAMQPALLFLVCPLHATCFQGKLARMW
jgi:hypothetical protein